MVPAMADSARSIEDRFSAETRLSEVVWPDLLTTALEVDARKCSIVFEQLGRACSGKPAGFEALSRRVLAPGFKAGPTPEGDFGGECAYDMRRKHSGSPFGGHLVAMQKSNRFKIAPEILPLAPCMGEDLRT